MFGIIPFILLKKEELGKINIRIYYFLVQVFGRMLFLWGKLIKFYLLGVVGLCIKMGISPFFWWVPAIFKRLDWYSIVLVGTIQKIPSFIILRQMFDFSKDLGLFIAISGLIVSIVGINYSKNNIKVLMGWSSVGNKRLVLYLMILHSQAALMYFFCYCRTFIIVSYLFINKSSENVDHWRKVRKKSDFLISIGLAILIFSGLPPLLGFQWKVFFFRALKMPEVYLMLEQLSVIEIKDYMIEFPLCQDMGGWNLGLIIRFLLVLQIAAYIKVFINIHSSFSRSLEGRRRLKSKNLKMEYYLLRITIISLIFLVI